MDKEPFKSRCPVIRLEGWLRDKSTDANMFKLELAQSQEDFLKEKDSRMDTWTFDADGDDANEDHNDDVGPVREQEVIELLSDSDDETTRPVQHHQKSEVKFKVETCAVAVLTQQMEEMRQQLHALLPRQIAPPKLPPRSSA